MAGLRYAGVGARRTPDAVLNDMTVIAGWLARAGWELATGGAHGADEAFRRGAGGRSTVWLPWESYNGFRSRGAAFRVPTAGLLEDALFEAAQVHPAWSRCRESVRRLHARNACIVLGEKLAAPVDALICWTEGGAVTGGTGLALRIACSAGVPVFNLAVMAPRAVCGELLKIREEKIRKGENK